MPAVTRIDVDPSAGHCYSPRELDTGSPDVFTNNLKQTRVTDHYKTHCCGPVCHDGKASEGSPNVFVNNLPIHRIGDAIDCGDKSASGSPDVFANS
jgi:uncharacterized Zn-binding protein involved in type VI secretion